MTGHLRGDARKRATDAHQIHHDPAVRDLIERERRAAAVEAWDAGATKAAPYGGAYLRSVLAGNPHRLAGDDA